MGGYYQRYKKNGYKKNGNGKNGNRYQKRWLSRKYKKNKFIPLYPVPRVQIVKLKYVDTYTLAPAGADTGTALHWIRANDLYDPDLTAGGHQPLGFDQHMAFYDNFTVVGSKISARFMTTSNTDTGQSVVGIIKSDVTTLPSNLRSTICEQPNTKYRMLTNGAAIGKEWCQSSFSVKKDMRISAPMAEPLIEGNATASPTLQYYFGLFAVTDDNTTDVPARVNVQVTVQYIALLHGRKPLAQS